MPPLWPAGRIDPAGFGRTITGGLPAEQRRL